MRIRYFVADVHGRIHKAEQATVEAVWEGDRSVLELGVALGDCQPLVTNVQDKDLHPSFNH
jgi:hypothetical protein